MCSSWKTSYLLKPQMMERNIILLQPWPLVKLQVLDVFNDLESVNKSHIWEAVWSWTWSSMNTPPKINGMIKIYCSVTQQNHLAAKAVLTMPMFGANTSSPSRISSLGKHTEVSTGVAGVFSLSQQRKAANTSPERCLISKYFPITFFKLLLGLNGKTKGTAPMLR